MYLTKLEKQKNPKSCSHIYYMYITHTYVSWTIHWGTNQCSNHCQINRTVRSQGFHGDFCTICRPMAMLVLLFPISKFLRLWEQILPATLSLLSAAALLLCTTLDFSFYACGPVVDTMRRRCGKGMRRRYRNQEHGTENYHCTGCVQLVSTH